MQRLKVGLLVVVALGAMAGSWKTMLSPGPMAPAHADQAGNCDACHLSFAGIPNSRCLDCHDGLAARIEAGRSFHATVADQECIACHSDHDGDDALLTKAPAKKAFDHETTGFSLAGSHSGKKCEDCHERPIAEMKAVCATCHEDAHQSALGPTCDSCHQPASWAAGIKALSAHLLSMEGEHGKQDCSDCHLHGENLTGDVPCANCHEDVHGGTVTACDQCHEVTGFKPARFDHGPCTCAFPGKHQTVECLACHEGFEFANTPIVCSGCHTKDRPHDPIGECSACHTATSWVDNRFDHNRQASFKIEGAHEAVSCVQCHSDGAASDAKEAVATQFRGAPTTCIGCHHQQGDEAHGHFGACVSCHTVQGWSPSSFDHASTGFVLQGRHTTLGCPACHDGKVKDYPR